MPGPDQPEQAQDELIGPEATDAAQHRFCCTRSKSIQPPENLHTLARRGHGPSFAQVILLVIAFDY